MKGVCPSFWDNACRLLFPLLLHLQASAFVLNLPIQPGGVVWLPNCLFQHKLIHSVFFLSAVHYSVSSYQIDYFWNQSEASLAFALVILFVSKYFQEFVISTRALHHFPDFILPLLPLLLLCFFNRFIYWCYASLDCIYRFILLQSVCPSHEGSVSLFLHVLSSFSSFSLPKYIYGFLNRNSRRPWSYARSFLFAQLLWLPFLEIWRKGKIEQQQSGRQGCFEGRLTMIRFGNISHSAVSGSSLTTSLATFQFCSLAELNEFVCFSQGNEFMEHGNLTWNCIQKGKQIRIYLVTPSINPWS